MATTKKQNSNSGAKYRSAETGKYVKQGFAKTHPKTTVKESPPKKAK